MMATIHGSPEEKKGLSQHTEKTDYKREYAKAKRVIKKLPTELAQAKDIHPKTQTEAKLVMTEDKHVQTEDDGIVDQLKQELDKKSQEIAILKQQLKRVVENIQSFTSSIILDVDPTCAVNSPLSPTPTPLSPTPAHAQRQPLLMATHVTTNTPLSPDCSETPPRVKKGLSSVSTKTCVNLSQDFAASSAPAKDSSKGKESKEVSVNESLEKPSNVCVVTEDVSSESKTNHDTGAKDACESNNSDFVLNMDSTQMVFVDSEKCEIESSQATIIPSSLTQVHESQESTDICMNTTQYEAIESTQESSAKKCEIESSQATIVQRSLTSVHESQEINMCVNATQYEAMESTQEISAKNHDSEMECEESDTQGFSPRFGANEIELTETESQSDIQTTRAHAVNTSIGTQLGPESTQGSDSVPTQGPDFGPTHEPEVNSISDKPSIVELNKDADNTSSHESLVSDNNLDNSVSAANISKDILESKSNESVSTIEKSTEPPKIVDAEVDSPQSEKCTGTNMIGKNAIDSKSGTVEMTSNSSKQNEIAVGTVESENAKIIEEKCTNEIQNFEGRACVDSETNNTENVLSTVTAQKYTDMEPVSTESIDMYPQNEVRMSIPLNIDSSDENNTPTDERKNETSHGTDEVDIEKKTRAANETLESPLHKEEITTKSDSPTKYEHSISNEEMTVKSEKRMKRKRSSDKEEVEVKKSKKLGDHVDAESNVKSPSTTTQAIPDGIQGQKDSAKKLDSIRPENQDKRVDDDKTKRTEDTVEPNTNKGSHEKESVKVDTEHPTVRSTKSPKGGKPKTNVETGASSSRSSNSKKSPKSKTDLRSRLGKRKDPSSESVRGSTSKTPSEKKEVNNDKTEESKPDDLNEKEKHKLIIDSLSKYCTDYVKKEKNRSHRTGNKTRNPRVEQSVVEAVKTYTTIAKNACTRSKISLQEYRKKQNCMLNDQQNGVYLSRLEGAMAKSATLSCVLNNDNGSAVDASAFLNKDKFAMGVDIKGSATEETFNETESSMDVTETQPENTQENISSLNEEKPQHKPTSRLDFSAIEAGLSCFASKIAGSKVVVPKRVERTPAPQMTPSPVKETVPTASKTAESPAKYVVQPQSAATVSSIMALLKDTRKQVDDSKNTENAFVVPPVPCGNAVAAMGTGLIEQGTLQWASDKTTNYLSNLNKTATKEDESAINLVVSNSITALTDVHKELIKSSPQKIRPLRTGFACALSGPLPFGYQSPSKNPLAESQGSGNTIPLAGSDHGAASMRQPFKIPKKPEFDNPVYNPRKELSASAQGNSGLGTMRKLDTSFKIPKKLTGSNKKSSAESSNSSNSNRKIPLRVSPDMPPIQIPLDRKPGLVLDDPRLGGPPLPVAEVRTSVCETKEKSVAVIQKRDPRMKGRWDSKEKVKSPASSPHKKASQQNTALNVVLDLLRQTEDRAPNTNSHNPPNSQDAPPFTEPQQPVVQNESNVEELAMMMQLLTDPRYYPDSPFINQGPSPDLAQMAIYMLSQGVQPHTVQQHVVNNRPGHNDHAVERSPRPMTSPIKASPGAAGATENITNRHARTHISPKCGTGHSVSHHGPATTGTSPAKITPPPPPVQYRRGLKKRIVEKDQSCYKSSRVHSDDLTAANNVSDTQDSTLWNMAMADNIVSPTPGSANVSSSRRSSFDNRLEESFSYDDIPHVQTTPTAADTHEFVDFIEHLDFASFFGDKAKCNDGNSERDTERDTEGTEDEAKWSTDDDEEGESESCYTTLTEESDEEGSEEEKLVDTSGFGLMIDTNAKVGGSNDEGEKEEQGDNEMEVNDAAIALKEDEHTESGTPVTHMATKLDVSKTRYDGVTDYIAVTQDPPQIEIAHSEDKEEDQSSDMDNKKSESYVSPSKHEQRELAIPPCNDPKESDDVPLSKTSPVIPEQTEMGPKHSVDKNQQHLSMNEDVSKLNEERFDSETVPKEDAASNDVNQSERSIKEPGTPANSSCDVQPTIMTSPKESESKISKNESISEGNKSLPKDESTCDLNKDLLVSEDEDSSYTLTPSTSNTYSSELTRNTNSSELTRSIDTPHAMSTPKSGGLFLKKLSGLHMETSSEDSFIHPSSSKGTIGSRTHSSMLYDEQHSNFIVCYSATSNISQQQLDSDTDPSSTNLSRSTGDGTHVDSKGAIDMTLEKGKCVEQERPIGFNTLLNNEIFTDGANANDKESNSDGKLKSAEIQDETKAENQNQNEASPKPSDDSAQMTNKPINHTPPPPNPISEDDNSQDSLAVSPLKRFKSRLSPKVLQTVIYSPVHQSDDAMDKTMDKADEDSYSEASSCDEEEDQPDPVIEEEIPQPNAPTSSTPTSTAKPIIPAPTSQISPTPASQSEDPHDIDSITLLPMCDDTFDCSLMSPPSGTKRMKSVSPAPVQSSSAKTDLRKMEKNGGESTSKRTERSPDKSADINRRSPRKLRRASPEKDKTRSKDKSKRDDVRSKDPKRVPSTESSRSRTREYVKQRDSEKKRERGERSDRSLRSDRDTRKSRDDRTGGDVKPCRQSLRSTRDSGSRTSSRVSASKSDTRASGAQRRSPRGTARRDKLTKESEKKMEKYMEKKSGLNKSKKKEAQEEEEEVSDFDDTLDFSDFIEVDVAEASIEDDDVELSGDEQHKDGGENGNHLVTDEVGMDNSEEDQIQQLTHSNDGVGYKVQKKDKNASDENEESVKKANTESETVDKNYMNDEKAEQGSDEDELQEQSENENVEVPNTSKDVSTNTDAKDKEGHLIDQDASLEEGELSDSLGDESQETAATKAEEESEQKEKRSTKKKAEDKRSKEKGSKLPDLRDRIRSKRGSTDSTKSRDKVSPTTAKSRGDRRDSARSRSPRESRYHSDHASPSRSERDRSPPTKADVRSSNSRERLSPPPQRRGGARKDGRRMPLGRKQLKLSYKERMDMRAGRDRRDGESPRDKNKRSQNDSSRDKPLRSSSRERQYARSPEARRKRGDRSKRSPSPRERRSDGSDRERRHSRSSSKERRSKMETRRSRPSRSSTNKIESDSHVSTRKDHKEKNAKASTERNSGTPIRSSRRVSGANEVEKERKQAENKSTINTRVKRKRSPSNDTTKSRKEKR